MILAMHRAAMAIVLLAAALARLHELGSQSLWLDEAFSVTIANSTPAHIIETTSQDVHPPLYYLLLYGWVHAIGGTDWTGRLFSVVADLGLLLIVYAFGTRMRNRATGLVAAVLLAISPFHIEYSQEARMYAFLALVATGATYCLWRIFEAVAPQRPGESDRPQHPLRWTTAYALLASTLTYTQVHGWFVLAAHAVIVMADIIRRRWQAELLAKHWVGAMLFVAVTFLLWLPVFVLQVRQVQAGFWIPAPEPNGLTAALTKYAGSVHLLQWLGPLAVWGAWSAWRAKAPSRDAPTPILFLVPWLVLPLLAPFALSFVGSSIFLPKYTIAASVPFALLVAIGLTRCKRWWHLTIAGAIVAYVISLSVAELRPYYTTVRKDQWREWWPPSRSELSRATR
jgi:mannosyltransferase